MNNELMEKLKNFEDQNKMELLDEIKSVNLDGDIKSEDMEKKQSSSMK